MDNNFFEEIINILSNQYYNSKWKDTLKKSFSKGEKIDEEGLITNLIINSSNEIIKFFHVLVLSGLYNSLNKETLEELLKKIEDYLIEIETDIEKLPDNKEKYEIQDYFQNNLIFVFKHYICSQLNYLIRDIEIQFQLEYKKGLFRANKMDSTFNSLDESIKDYVGSFYILLQITKIEHFKFSLNYNVIKELLIFKREYLEVSIDQEIKEAVVVKIDFLLKKFLYRQSLSKQDSLEPEFIYSFDQQEDSIISLDEVKINQSLSQWEKLIISHYGISKSYKTDQRNRKRDIEKKPHSEYLFSDFHGLIKIYKDDSKNIEQATNLYKLFLEIKQSDHLFDLYSNNITRSYLYNNLISLKCELNENDLNEIKELYFEIRNFQIEVNVRNYFPWEKLSMKISSIIDNLSKELFEPKIFDEFKSYLQLYKKCIDKLKETYFWSVNKNLTPIQLTFEECQSDYEVNIKNYTSFKLFFFTSFILPMNYSEVNSNRKNLENKLEYFNSVSTIYDRLKLVVGEVQNVSEEMRKQERRSIEILAIFSAVALFSVGSIQIFSATPVSNDPNVYFKFIFSFGYSLSLFVLLIWIITRENIKKIIYYHWIIIFILFIGTLLVIGYTVNSKLFDLIFGVFLT